MSWRAIMRSTSSRDIPAIYVVFTWCLRVTDLNFINIFSSLRVRRCSPLGRNASKAIFRPKSESIRVFTTKTQFWYLYEDNSRDMEIILTEQCTSITGSLGRGYGYSIQKRKDRFYSKRDSKGDVPFNGHWCFIRACAELALNDLHIDDILVTAGELKAALDEAGKIFYSSKLVRARKGEIWHASQVIDLVNNCGL